MSLLATMSKYAVLEARSVAMIIHSETHRKELLRNNIS